MRGLAGRKTIGLLYVNVLRYYLDGMCKVARRACVLCVCVCFFSILNFDHLQLIRICRIEQCMLKMRVFVYSNYNDSNSTPVTIDTSIDIKKFGVCKLDGIDVYLATHEVRRLSAREQRT